MGAPSPPPRPAPAPVPVPKPVAVDTTAQDTDQRQARNKRMGRSSLIVNRGGAQGLGGGDDNASIKKKTLG